MPAHPDNDTPGPRLSLLSDDFSDEMVRVLEYGARRHGEFTWLHGTAWTRHADSMRRHIRDWLAGETEDIDSGRHHLAHVAVGAMMLFVLEAQELGEDDRPGIMADFIINRLEKENGGSAP